MLAIICPDGELKYPREILENNPYIKGTLIHKHFFGPMAQIKPFFLNFRLKEAKCLIELIRNGEINLNDLELMEWIAFDSDTLLGTGVQMVKNGFINKYGIKVRSSSLKLQSITDYDVVFTPESLKTRREIFANAIKNTLKVILTSNPLVVQYLLIEDQISFAVYQNRYSLSFKGNMPQILETNANKLAQVKQAFWGDLDNLIIEWEPSEILGTVKDVAIFIPNRIKLEADLRGFSVGDRTKNPKILSLTEFIRHVYRYNPLYNTISYTTYDKIKPTDEEKQFLNEVYMALETAIDNSYEFSQ